jgi:hypothetical protein
MSLALRRSRLEADNDYDASPATFELKLGNIGSAHRRPAPCPDLARAGSPRRRYPCFAANQLLTSLDGWRRESRQALFIRKDELTDAEVRYFTDVDHHDHEAMSR